MTASTMIDYGVVIALMALAVSLTLLAAASMGVFHQLTRTLSSMERLTDTTREEMGPTLRELREVLDGVNQIKSITAQRVNEVSHKVEDVTSNVGHVVGSASKHSTIWGTGLLAGVRAYLAPKNHIEDKQLTMDRGESNELKQ